MTSPRARPLGIAGVLSLSLAAPACFPVNNPSPSASAAAGSSSAAAQPPTETEVEEKPKGPVYAAPFTAEQIQRATKNGRTYRFKVEAPDQPATEYALTFRNVDDLGAEISSDGSSAKRLSWRALQQQSEFPKDKVVTHLDSVKIAPGRFDCTVYEVSGEDGETWTYYFAKKLPGAPVFFFVTREGERLRTTTLVDYIPGG